MIQKFRTIETKKDEVTIEVVDDVGNTFAVSIGGLPPVGAGRNLIVEEAIASIIADQKSGKRRDMYEIGKKLVDLQLKSIKKPEKVSASPPPLAEFCISFLAPKNTAQALLGDLQEMFRANIRRLGEKQARRMYWMEVAASMRPLVWTWIKRIGFFTALVGYLRAKFGL